MDDNHWPSEWQRGVLDLCVLHILADGPTYGYSIAARLTDAGFADVKGGTLYPPVSYTHLTLPTILLV